MLGIASRIIGNLIVGTCFLSIAVFFLSLAASLRLLPKLLRFLLRMLRWFMILSYRLYAFTLKGLAQPAYDYFAIDLFANLWRIVVSLLISFALGTSLYLLIDLPNSEWIILAFSLHGFLVGLIWDKLLDPGGLMLGVGIDES